MFSKWLHNREKKKIQNLCPHEYHILTEREKENFFTIWYVNYMYCPVCDSEICVKLKEAERILERQKVRKRFEIQS